MNTKRTWFSVFAGLVLLLTSTLPAAVPQTVSYTCVPGTPGVQTYGPVKIVVSGTKHLVGKFFYPVFTTPSSPPVNFDPNTLPGVMMTHGFGQTYMNVEDMAQNLAKNCMVVLVFNYFGQGWDWEIDTRFDFYTTAERNELDNVITELKRGPIYGTQNDLDLVDDTRLGMLGESQGGAATWMMLADPDRRGKFLAFAPSDAAPFPSGVLITNGCLNANVGNIIAPNRARTPLWTPGNPTPTPNLTATPTPLGGAVWEPTTYANLYGAFVTPAVATWEAALSDRDFSITQLAEATAGTPHPHTYAQAGWYDTFQLADEAITPWATLTTSTPLPTPTVPGGANTPTPLPLYHQMRIGAGGHSDDAWKGNATEQAYRPLSKVGWMQSQLLGTPVNSATPSATPNGGGPATATPTPTPYPVEYMVDSSTGAGTPVFATRHAAVWPPPETQTVAPQQFYFQASGAARTVTPAAGLLKYDTVGQDLQQPAYNAATAIVEDPQFKNWATAIAVTPVAYTSAKLAQDVTLFGPPMVQLYTNNDGPSGLGQVHVRIYEKNPVSGKQWFITHANLCDWSTDSAPGEFTGTAYLGEPRFHTFKSGHQIVFELTTVDEEFYRPTQSAVSILPRLASFSLIVKRGRQGDNSNVTLPLLPSNPASAIWQADGAAPQRYPVSVPAATATPGPLQLVAYVNPPDTNPGDWRAWALHVTFECSGGTGAVTCPEEQWIWSDGADQSFTYEAHDEAGNTARVTLSGLNMDRTAPALAVDLPQTQTFCSGAALPLSFSVGDAVSGVQEIDAYFNGRPVSNAQTVPLLAGANTLSVYMGDVAGNGIVGEATVQVNYALTPDFPPDGQSVDPRRPLPFHFTIADACALDGKYTAAVGTLWLTGPDGVEIPAQWAGGGDGNQFGQDPQARQYTFSADVSGLASGLWTARVHLDDGNDYLTTFVVP